MPINPDYISELVNFYSISLKEDWTYDPKAEDMRSLQVKGAAKAFNLLEKYKVALLADEVGMGKTIQSLAVCSALWNQTPNAKILITVPRDEIAKNWEREYQTFISHHYRNNDNIVKSLIGSEPMKKMVYCRNLYSLVHEIKQGWGQLFISKISSFSSLMAGNKSLDRLQGLGVNSLSKAQQLSENPGIEFSNEIMRLLKKEILRCCINEQPYFDLVIIDEAHYLRNKDGDSLKVNSAKVFFGDPNSNNYSPITKKTLLLTATPNHSSSKDIKNIVSYFSNRFQGNEYKEILDLICIRRLRRLSSKALNKYNYRHEVASKSDFKDKPLSEMFFGLYQHELAKEVNRNKNGAKGISGMMKYLEGVEFLPTKGDHSENEDSSNDENNGNSYDYKKGADSQMLTILSKKYHEIFNTDPSHPKYEKLVKDLTDNQNGEKAVVFVRRIPSVQEISKRVIEFYDKRLWSVLQNGNLMDLGYEKLDRKTFNRNLEQPVSSEGGDGNNDEETEDSKNIPSSRVLNLFKVIKNNVPTHTAASNFRLRFNRSKPGLFAMFFSPGENYFDAPYADLKSFRFQVGKEELENYYSSALIQRTGMLSDKAISKDILSRLLNRNPINKTHDTKPEVIPTLITIFWEVLDNDDSFSGSDKEVIRKQYGQFSYAEKEAFSNYVEKGTLLASEAVVKFFDIFRNSQSEDPDSAVSQYLKFCLEVKVNLKSMKLYLQIIESIRQFKVLYTKVFSINNEKELLDESWDSFNNAQPIYPYSADNSNQKVLRCFNTPFYPDMLVATSVLQEGVNLQYFCNTVYHYGMAWTPGDNEQRIGRIDRMFGKIERLLEENEKSTLKIYYPYLKDTVDEEHLGRFVKRKFREEALIDMGKSFEESPDYALEENDINGWARFLREPDSQNIYDPFPVCKNDFDGILTKKLTHKANDVDQYYSAIRHAIEDLEEFKPEIYLLNREGSKSLLIDPTLDNKRRQPVIVELVIDHIGSSLTGSVVYTVTMKTPLAAVTQFKPLKNRFYGGGSIQDIYSPGIKLCLDVSQTGGSVWGLYVKADLPLFCRELTINPISVEEVQWNFRKIITVSDAIEKEVFHKDLTKEELNMRLKKENPMQKHRFRKASGKTFDLKWTKDKDLLIKNVILNEFGGVDAEKKALIINHQEKFVKVYRDNGSWIAQVSIPSVDPQKEEMDLLERHQNIFVQSLNWEQNL